MSYAKLFSSITESSLWSEPKEVRLLFVSMLARADSTGFVEASLPGLARMANLTLSEVEIALEVLEGPDRHSKNPEFDGCRVAKVDGGWMLLNYEAYRNRRSDEERREYMRAYMADYRRKHAVNKGANSKPDVNPRKPPLAQEETEPQARTNTCRTGCDAPAVKSKNEYPAAFEEFWQIYPARDGRRNGKRKTLSLWKRVAESDRGPLLAATGNFARSRLAQENKARDPERFLKDDWWRGWLEDPEAAGQSSLYAELTPRPKPGPALPPAEIHHGNGKAHK